MTIRHLSALLLLGATPAAATPSQDLQQLLAEHWTVTLRESPQLASSVGVHDYDTELGDPSLAAEDRRAAQSAAFLSRLRAIPDEGLSGIERTNKAILARLLAEDVEANRFGQRAILFTSYSSPWQGMAGLGERLAFRGKQDFANYLARLDKWPAVNDQLIAITANAIRDGYVQPCVALAGFERSITGVITADPATSRFYAPFRGPRPADASPAEWAALQSSATRVIADRVSPAYAKFATFYRTTYLPKCARTVGVSAQPGGRAYYAFRVRQLTTTTYTPAQIHRIGLDEVARIRRAMTGVAVAAGYPTREAFVAELRTNPRYYVKSPDELLAAAALVAKTIDGKLPQLFHRLPRLPYGIRAIPAETAEGTTTAYYGPGSPPNGLAGTYYVNTSKLDQRPLWELPSLTAHEAVPGHHNQIATQQELALPPLRTRLASFTAFTEGWALYAETLGEEMGLYDTPEKRMGRLSYDMWRACRLVVDTGIHAQGWTKERAVAFMLDNTALSAANIDAEVNRYISWPGQALGYKLGELKILELRARAQKALGVRFDLASFNDTVLEQGSVPLDVLERHVDAWIAAGGPSTRS
ncbi:Uncharacterized conserved protein, DUF885 familyt [Sphingomonas guangdongensis]|uniref:Uncharacterized conserved protein, DUF885 familyt n=1 Tax=Sphingomonas guangdongensis TaxID=1141890 RepID=A0A285R276_9SPHN|nr:DUF885 domain-containing protein [Sphingomonas guangdongensis]SOB88191.1 Uncharacterized conserved protein, DUF885 familyt [Sphingomonas guangdongensis]